VDSFAKRKGLTMRETNRKRVKGISLESACLEGRHSPISIPSAMLPHHPGALPLVGGLVLSCVNSRNYSCHSRAGGNPEVPLSPLGVDSCFRRNDTRWIPVPFGPLVGRLQRQWSSREHMTPIPATKY